MKLSAVPVILQALNIYRVASSPGIIDCVSEEISSGKTLLIGTNLNWAGSAASDYNAYISMNPPTNGTSLPTQTTSVEEVQATQVQLKMPYAIEDDGTYYSIIDQDNGYYTLCISSASMYSLSDCAPPISHDTSCPPTQAPTQVATQNPTLTKPTTPSRPATVRPSSILPSKNPTRTPTTEQPSTAPSTLSPTSEQPSTAPSTLSPTSEQPSIAPSTLSPTSEQPSIAPSTLSPTSEQPSIAPSTLSPTSEQPSIAPSTLSPTSEQPSIAPSTLSPTSEQPSVELTTVRPTSKQPSRDPTLEPSVLPTPTPTTLTPTGLNSGKPTMQHLPSQFKRVQNCDLVATRAGVGGLIAGALIMLGFFTLKKQNSSCGTLTNKISKRN